MKLRNDNERRAYLDDPKNWNVINQMPGVRLLEFEYKGFLLYRLELWQTWRSGYDFENHKHKEETGWREVFTYTLREDTHAYSYPVSTGEIIRKLKELDKGRETK